MPGISTARLCGADHRELDEIASVAEGRAAVAISRGGAPKRYPHRDPNEDAVGFALSDWGAVAVVADAHAGGVAAEVCVARVLESHAPRWLAAAPIALDARFASEALEVALDANAAILRSTTGSDAGASRTTLAVALLRPRDDWVAVLSIGDSHVFRVDRQGAQEVAPEKGDHTSFLGDATHTAERLAASVRAQVVPLEDARAIVLATDGLSERGIGVLDPGATVAAVVHRASEAQRGLRALEAARGVVECALASHRENRSGDNIAAAALWIG